VRILKGVGFVIVLLLVVGIAYIYVEDQNHTSEDNARCYTAAIRSGQSPDIVCR